MVNLIRARAPAHHFSFYAPLPLTYDVTLLWFFQNIDFLRRPYLRGRNRWCEESKAINSKKVVYFSHIFMHEIRFKARFKIMFFVAWIKNIQKYLETFRRLCPQTRLQEAADAYMLFTLAAFTWVLFSVFLAPNYCIRWRELQLFATLCNPFMLERKSHFTQTVRECIARWHRM